MFTSTVVKQLFDHRAGLGFPVVNPVVTIILAAETPISGFTQLLVPLTNNKRCALK